MGPAVGGLPEPEGAEGLRLHGTAPRGWCGVCLRTCFSPLVINVKQKQNEMANLRIPWCREPMPSVVVAPWPALAQEVGASPAPRPRSVSASAGTAGEAVWPPRRWRSARFPRLQGLTQVCADAAEVFISCGSWSVDRAVSQDHLLSGAEAACSMEFMPSPRSAAPTCHRDVNCQNLTSASVPPVSGPLARPP